MNTAPRRALPALPIPAAVVPLSAEHPTKHRTAPSPPFLHLTSGHSVGPPPLLSIHSPPCQVKRRPRHHFDFLPLALTLLRPHVLKPPRSADAFGPPPNGQSHYHITGINSKVVAHPHPGESSPLPLFSENLGRDSPPLPPTSPMKQPGTAKPHQRPRHHRNVAARH
jgi:hypothetical protein